MNSTKLATRLLFMARQLQGEAQRHPPGRLRNDLSRGSRQLSYAHRAAWSTDPDNVAQAEALLEGSIDYLVDVITARTDRELTKGTSA